MKTPLLGVGIALVLGLASSASAWEVDGLRLRGRLQTRFELRDKSSTDDGDEWTSFFLLRRARLDAAWDPNRYLKMMLELELSDLFQVGEDLAVGNVLRDVYARLRWNRKLQVHLGHFKKPFSRLRLASPWEIVIPERGMMDKYLIAEDASGGFGGRSLGVMVSGRFKKLAGLEYALGAFNSVDFLHEYQKAHRDVVLRLGVEPVRGLQLGLGGSGKQILQGGGYTWVYLLGVDAAFEVGGLCLALEGAYGENPNSFGKRKALGGHGTVSYAFALGEDLILTPAAVVEAFDPDNETAGVGLRVAGAVNLDFWKVARLVLFFEMATHQPEVAQEFAVETLRYPTRIGLQLNLAI